MISPSVTSTFSRIPALVEEAYLRLRPSLLRHLPSRRWTDARFHKLIWVDPREIVHYQDIREWRHPRIRPYRPAAGTGARRFVRANVGKVIDGDWDLARVPFEQNDIYRLLHEHFALGVEWEQTEVFRRYARDIAAGKRRWHWSSSYEELLATSREVERLYQRIRDEGYRAREESGGWRSRPGDEITVSIGRNGELLYNNVGGHHRLSIAKLLGIEEIPVRVMLRHRQWQDVRDELRRASRAGGLHSTASGADRVSERVRRHLRHPDLSDLLP